MKLIRSLSITGTVINFISAVIYSVFALILALGGTSTFFRLAGDSMNKVGTVDPNSPAGGFEVLAYLLGSGMSYFGGIIMFLAGLALFAAALYQVPAIVTGFIANKRFKACEDIEKCYRPYRNDGLVKSIMSGIVVAISVLAMGGDITAITFKDLFPFLIFSWNHVIVLFLGIFQLIAVKRNQ